MSSTPASLTVWTQTRGEDEIHLAAGIGVAFERFQLDFGIDFSDLVDTASLSAIYTF